MSLSKSIVKNTFIQVGGKVIGTALSLVAAGMMLRYLGEAGTGKYTGVFSFLQIFGILMDLGLYVILVKNIARIDKESEPLVNSIFTIRLLAGITLLLMAPGVAWIIGQFKPFYSTEIILTIAATGLFFLFISLNQLLSAVFQKFLATQYIALGEFIGKLVMLGSVALAIYMELSFFWIMMTFVASAAANFLVNFIASRKYFHIKFRFDKEEWIHIMKEAWPIAISITFGVIYFKGDAVLLTLWENEATVGEYGAPYRGLEVLVTFPAMFAGLAMPVITAAWQDKDMDRFKRVLQKSFDGLTLIALGAIAGTLVLAPQMVYLLAGEGFDRSDEIMRILIIATSAIYLGTLYGYIAPAIGKQKQLMWGFIFVAITALGAYIYAIPRWSIYGAAWVTVYAEIAILAIAMAIVYTATNTAPSLSRTWRFALAATIMYALLSFITPQLFSEGVQSTWDSVIQLAVLVPAGGIVYITVSILLGALKIQELLEFLPGRR